MSTSQEYSIRVPKHNKKKFQVMRFNNSVNVDFGKWSQVKMERENNMKEFRGADEEQPKFGAGSEFGRETREEARRKKFGIISRKYRPEDQPWLLKVGGKTGKKYKGIREGGVGENAAYYVFTHAADGAIEAFPLKEWYNFQPIQCYKALSAEEAEEEFGRRNKMMNYFTIMTRKRLGKDDDGELDGPEDGKFKKGSNKKKELQISEMDDWVDSDDDSSSNPDEDKEKKDPEESENKKNKKGKKKRVKKRRSSESEAGEESDDGDEEGREMDYISDSSASDSDKELKGVAEEDALRKLLSSGEDDEDEEKQDEKNKDKESEGDETKAKEGDNADSKDNTSKDGNKSSNSKKKKKKTKKNIFDKKKKDEIPTAGDSSSDLSSDSDGPTGTTSASRSATPTHDKSGTSSELTSNDRKRSIQAVLASANNDSPPAKQSRFDPLPTECGITEDAVRRYLARKPMTTTELLQKFKSKKTGLSSDQLVNTMTLILKRINPTRQTIKGKMYLSIPNDKRSNQLSMPSSDGGSSGGPDMQI